MYNSLQMLTSGGWLYKLLWSLGQQAWSAVIVAGDALVAAGAHWLILSFTGTRTRSDLASLIMLQVEGKQLRALKIPKNLQKSVSESALTLLTLANIAPFSASLVTRCSAQHPPRSIVRELRLPADLCKNLPSRWHRNPAVYKSWEDRKCR